MSTAVSTNPYTQMCPAFTPGQPHLHPYIIDQVTEKCQQTASALFEEKWEIGKTGRLFLELILTKIANPKEIHKFLNQAFISRSNFMGYITPHFIPIKARQWLEPSVCGYTNSLKRFGISREKAEGFKKAALLHTICQQKFLSLNEVDDTLRKNIVHVFNKDEQPRYALQVAAKYLSQMEALAKKDPSFNLDIVHNQVENLLSIQSLIPRKYSLDSLKQLLEIKKSLLENSNSFNTSWIIDNNFKGYLYLTQLISNMDRDLNTDTRHGRANSFDPQIAAQTFELLLSSDYFTRLDDYEIIRLITQLIKVCSNQSCEGLIKKLITDMYLFLEKRGYSLKETYPQHLSLLQNRGDWSVVQFLLEKVNDDETYKTRVDSEYKKSNWQMVCFILEKIEDIKTIPNLACILNDLHIAGYQDDLKRLDDQYYQRYGYHLLTEPGILNSLSQMIAKPFGICLFPERQP